MARTLALFAAVSLAIAQAPAVGDINFYGLRKITPERILATVNLKAGSPLPPSKGEMEEAIANVPGVLLARVEAVCCEGPRAIVFIGVEEKGSPHAAFRSDPAGEGTLPPELVDSYQRFLGAVARAASEGNAAEDLTAGHSLMSDPAARAVQSEFVSFAETHLPLLRDVLRSAAEPEQRAIAAAVIDYAPRKQDIVNDLQYALQDPDESVRANAARSLKAIAVLAAKQPSLGLKISPTWFVELLNSVVLSDRVEAAGALVTLTDRGEASVLQLIRERALPSLEEMARWKTPRYALPPYLLLGRVAGLPEDEIQQSWEKGDRETVISKALATATRKPG